MPPETPGGKSANTKRASLPRRSDFTKAFEKDWRRLERTGRYNMAQLKEVMMLIIANAAPLPPEWKDHVLSGNWADHRECHVGGDFLLSIPLTSKIIWLFSPAPERIRNCSNSAFALSATTQIASHH